MRTLLCEGPGGFQAFAEQSYGEDQDGLRRSETRLAASVVAGRVRVYRGTRFSRVPGMSGSLEVEVLCTA